MPLASGADVAIGAYEFNLATDVEDPYIHMYENLYGDTGEIEGTDGKKAANKNILFWGYDDFRRGDGLRYWDKDQPDRWWFGNNNPRIPGAITSPPTRSTSSTITVNTGSTSDGCMTAVNGRAWFFRHDQGFYSTDGATWTENTDVATELPASYEIRACCNDGEYAYIAADDGTGNRGIWRITSTTVVDDFVTAHAGTGSARYWGLASRDQYIYAWSGGALYRYNSLDTLPITHADATHRVFRPGVEFASASGKKIVAGEDAVYMMRASTGITTVFEFKVDPQTGKMAGRTVWNMPSGFVGQEMCTQAGVLLVGGSYLNRAALWGYSTITRQPFFLGYIGEGVDGTGVRCIFPAHGAQVIISVDSSATTEYLFVYDLEEDSFSQLDEAAAATMGTPNAGVTFEDQRLVAASFTATTSKVHRWPLDTSTPAGSWTWYSSAHDIDYPQDEKVLIGFHVIQDPSIAAGTVQVYYQLDEDGSWTSAGTTAGGAKHTFLTVSSASSTKKFRTIRLRMDGSSGCRVFSLTGRFYINSIQEVWRLKLDMRNEPGTLRKPSNRASVAAKLRDNLHTLVTDRNVVTFKDGRRKRRSSSTSGTGYTTHTVLVEFPKDAADSGREGVAEVILRSVAPSA